MLLAELNENLLFEAGYSYKETSPGFYEFTTNSGIKMFAEASRMKHPDYGLMLVFLFGFRNPEQVGAESSFSPLKIQAQDALPLFSTLRVILQDVLKKKEGTFDTLEFDTSVPQLKKTYDMLAPRIEKMLPADYKYLPRESYGTKVYLFSRLPELQMADVQTQKPAKQKSIFSKLFSK